jgi:transposase
MRVARGAWLCFEDETGQGLRPPKARTWARKGHTPSVSVSGKRSGRVNIAGLLCVKPGHRTRLSYRLRIYHARRGERAGFTEADYATLISAAHQQLRGPIVLVWDNLNVHTSALMHDFVRDHRDWLRVVRLPAYAPELNPADGVWANLKNSLGNMGSRSLDQLADTVKHLLKRMQYRPDLLDGFIAETGLTLHHPQPT